MAFGCPLGYIGSMTHGIVSALNRSDVGILESVGGYEDFIQVDAPINPGNSGGPLVNIHGEVVGINTAIATRTGLFAGIGFAIPSNQAKTVYEALKSHGKVERGWLGIGIEDIGVDNPGLAKSFNFTGTGGVLVTETFPDTPAYGKLHHGDIIIGLNGQSIENRQQLRNLVAQYAPGTKVSVKILREGNEQAVDLILGQQPADVMAFAGRGNHENGEEQAPAQSSAASKWGLTLSDLDSAAAQKEGLNNVTEGAMISEVAPDSLAFDAGLRRGYVITEVGNTKIHNAQEASDALAKSDVKDGVRLYVTTPQGSDFVFLQGNQ
jgi:serine protease Do